MPIVYADTSFLVSLYVDDANSWLTDAAVKHFAGFQLTELGEVEFTNAVALRVFRAEMLQDDSRRVLADFRADIERGFFHRFAIGPAVYERALKLSLRHTSHLGTRGLDLLHVASALEFEAPQFVTFDKSQARLARAVGLRVSPRL